MQLIFQMQQLANDQEYLIICNHSEEINKLVADIARQNYTAPREGFIMDNLQSVMELSDKALVYQYVVKWHINCISIFKRRHI